MSYISENTINKVKERLNITDVVKDYMKLKKSGRNWTGLCPFHIEKTPSFFVNEEKGIYHCFGCSASGNMFNFIMRVENVPFPESIKILAQKAGITVEYKDGAFTEQYKIQELIHKVNERASFIFQYYMTNRPEGERVRKYLKERRIKDETAEVFKLGYAPDSYDKLHSELLKENYNAKTILDAGLIIKSSNRQGYYDRFRNRLMFPIINAMNNIIGFGGRLMNETEGLAKYMNTPETEVYSKRFNLYGINVTHNHIREKRQAIVVEGYFDAIALYQEGIRNVVALLGTSLTNEQILLLKRYADEVVLLFDSDKAGNAATIKSISILLNTNLKIKIVELPVNTDPDEYVFKQGPASLLKLISAAPSFLKFIVVTAFKKFHSENVE
ncbi:MAG: DNA primase, partial [bacterium]|nr:DNA primase [bacterium]